MIETIRCINCFKDIDSSVAGGEICPHCGQNNFAENIKGALPYRTILLNRYMTGKVKLSNSEGFTYAGYDLVEQKRVDIREFCPVTLCYRQDTVIFPAADFDEQFNRFYADFIEMANSLLKITNLAGMPEICDLISTNNTSYIVYGYNDSVSLKTYIENNGGKLDFNTVSEFFRPIFNSLSKMHSFGIKHLGISPETLRIGTDNKMRLSEFSIEAIRTIGSGLDCDLNPSCCSYEQYSQNLEHNEASDVYALASCMLYAISGQLPNPIKQRLENPKLMLSNDIVKSLPRSSLVALASALQIKPAQRTTNFGSFKFEFFSDLEVEEQMECSQVIEDIPLFSEKESKKSSTPKLWLLISFAISVLIVFAFGYNYIKTNDLSLGSIIEFFYNPDDTPLQTLVKIPDMEGDYYIDWVSRIENNVGYRFTIEKLGDFSDEVEEGLIISQDPEPNSSILIDGKVEVIVSLGPEMRTLPNVNNMSIEAVEKLLAKDGIMIQKVYVTTPDFPKDYVLWYGDDYVSGDEVKYGSVVPVLISTGS